MTSEVMETRGLSVTPLPEERVSADRGLTIAAPAPATNFD
jgi:hypothetical protein